MAFLLPLAVWVTPASARVLYVNASAKAGTAVDGTSWARAFRDLQDALALAQPGDEIWLAAGTYRPDRGTGDRDMSFVVEGGASLYGGFSGRETAREQRDWVRNETVLSGDLNDDDGPANCAEVSNCCVEHDGYSCDDAECESRVCNVYPACCKQPDNSDNGWDEECTYFAKLECCELGTWNSCENSRVIVRIPEGDAPVVMDGLSITSSYDAVSIGEHEAYSAAIDLGAASLTLKNCSLSDNARYGVNSLADAPERSVTVENCRFEKSVGAYALRLHNHQVSVSDSAFEDNNIAMSARSAKVYKCVFSDNYEGLSLSGTGNVVEDSQFGGNVVAGRIGGLGSSARVSRCYFIENENGLAVGSAVVSDCVFLDNMYEGLHCGGSATADVRRCVIMGIGKGTEEGGRYGVSVQFGGLVLSDSVVAGNRTWSGPGAVSVDSFSSVVIRNSVIADNHYSIRGSAGIWVRDSDVTLENSIAWGNWDRDGIAEDTQIGGIGDSTIEVNNSIVQDWSGVLGGVGNSGDDPLFVDPLGPDEIPGTGDENYRLTPDSPAIDAGDPGFVPYSGQTDLDGFPRVLCGRVDMGAYEFGIGDQNCDHVVDLRDFSAWESCMTGPLATRDAPWTQFYDSGCESFDSEYDGDVDLKDYGAIQNMGFQP